MALPTVLGYYFINSWMKFSSRALWCSEDIVNRDPDIDAREIALWVSPNRAYRKRCLLLPLVATCSIKTCREVAHLQQNEPLSTIYIQLVQYVLTSTKCIKGCLQREISWQMTHSNVVEMWNLNFTLQKGVPLVRIWGCSKSKVRMTHTDSLRVIGPRMCAHARDKVWVWTGACQEGLWNPRFQKYGFCTSGISVHIYGSQRLWLSFWSLRFLRSNESFQN